MTPPPPDAGNGSQDRRGLRIAHVSALDTSLSLLMVPLMRTQKQAGHDVFAVAGRDAGSHDDDRIERAGITFCEVNVERTLLSFSHLGSIRAYARLFRTEAFDVVHVHTPIAGVLARIGARIARTPVVIYTAHGLYFQEHTPQPKRSLSIAAEWLAGRFTDLLLSQSSEDADTARRLHLSKGPIEWIGNGVDPALFHPSAEGRTRIRSEMGLDDDRVVVLIVARLVEEKGYPELLEAFDDLDAELWIIGTAFENRSSGDVSELIDDAVSATGRPGLVRYLGRRDGVNAFMQAADIFVLPSHREGMPRSIIEAMMSALPVVASRIRGSREEVIHNETGLLIDRGDTTALRDTLRKLIANPELRQTMGKRGRQRALDLYVEDDCLSRQMHAIDAAITKSGLR